MANVSPGLPFIATYHIQSDTALFSCKQLLAYLYRQYGALRACRAKSETAGTPSLCAAAAPALPPCRNTSFPEPPALQEGAWQVLLTSVSLQLHSTFILHCSVLGFFWKKAIPRNSPTTGTEISAIRRCLCHSGKSGSTRPVTGLTPSSPWKPGRGSAKRSARCSVPQWYDREELRRFHSSMTTVDHSMLNTAWSMWPLIAGAESASWRSTAPEPETESIISLWTSPEM